MSRRLRSIALMIALVGLLATACRTSSPVEDATDRDDPQTERSGDDAVDPQDPGPPLETSPDDAPRIVPPLVLPNGAPGTDAAAEELFDELSRFLTPEQAAAVPWPDLRNPDPVEVYQSASVYQNWMSENNATPSLTEAYTAPNSPERSFDIAMFDDYTANSVLDGPSTPPYSMRIEDLVHPAATGITDELLAQVPEGSAAVVYWDSVGTTDRFTTEGQYFDTRTGWTDVGPWVAIMAPTDVGWQVWWDELTEPPPPGSRQDGSVPEDEPDRVDL